MRAHNFPTVPDIALPSHGVPSVESFTSFENRQRSFTDDHPSPVVGRVAVPCTQIGQAIAAEPIQHGAQSPARAAASGPPAVDARRSTRSPVGRQISRSA